MEKLDMKKSLKKFYQAKSEITFVEVPAIKYICFEGSGDPGTSKDYQDAMGVLFGMAYTIKFRCKSEDRDFVVMPLEGNWWCDPSKDFATISRDEWLWEVMIALPDYVDEKMFEVARLALEKKKNPVGLDRATLKVYEDGLSTQFLYKGAYSDEAPFIKAMHDYINEQGYVLRDKHREIYLNSPLRVTTDKLKTIIRHPIVKK